MLFLCRCRHFVRVITVNWMLGELGIIEYANEPRLTHISMLLSGGCSPLAFEQNTNIGAQQRGTSRRVRGMFVGIRMYLTKKV
jgi:hypothetical protein